MFTIIANVDPSKQFPSHVTLTPLSSLEPETKNLRGTMVLKAG